MIHLPPFTLLCGPKHCGKSTLAELLQTQDSSLCRISFAEPIRMALLAAFHPEEMTLGIDLRDEAVKARTIPGTNVLYRDWMIDFSDWMKSRFNNYIFADIAKRTIASQEPYWTRFVFDDCRFLEEVDGIASSFGKDSVLVIHIEREGIAKPSASALHQTLGISGNRGIPILGPSTPIPGVRRAVVPNSGTPLEMISFLRNLLGDSQCPRPEPSSNPPQSSPSTSTLQ